MGQGVLGKGGNDSTEVRDEQIRGNTGSVISRGNLTQVGAGALQLRGGSSADSVGEGGYNVKLARGAKLTINQTSDPDLFRSVIESQREGSQSLTGTFSSGLNAVLGKLGDLAQSQQTGGESNRDKTILYVVAVVAAAIALILWRKK